MKTYDPRDLLNPAGLLKEVSQANENIDFRFSKGVVKEVIANPGNWLNLLLSNKKSKTHRDGYILDKTIQDILDPDLLKYAPANTILFYEKIGKNVQEKKANIAFPFYPSHISLPIKPGELVWIFKEELGNGSFFYYYMHRVHSIKQVEDVNYTQMSRTTAAINYINEKFYGIGSDTFEESRLLASGFDKSHHINKKIPPGLTYDKIHASSFAYLNEFTGEPVPQAIGQSSDFLLQGSNNTCIQLGQEKFKSNFNQLEGAPPSTQNQNSQRKPFSGAIDIFCGNSKGFVQETRRQNVENENIIAGSRTEASSFEYNEINKIDSENYYSIFNDNPRNVFSRLYMSMNCSVDEMFSIDSEFTKNTGPTLAGYSDHVRLFSERSIKLSNLGSQTVNMFQIDSQGEITLQAGKGETAAKIILRTNGNIVIKPGSNGYLFLGGDESQNDEMFVACGVPVKEKKEGIITGDTITTTLGGELFNSEANTSEPTIDVRETINTVAAAMAPANGASQAADLTLIQTGQSVPNAPGPLQLDGSSSSKVLIKVK